MATKPNDEPVITNKSTKKDPRETLEHMYFYNKFEPNIPRSNMTTETFNMKSIKFNEFIDFKEIEKYL